MDISLSLKSISSADEAAAMFKKWFDDKTPEYRPECVFVDLNIIGSSFDGIELIRKINFEYGNHVVIGIISSSNESEEQAKADIENPNTPTKEEHIQRDVKITVARLDIFGSTQ